MSATSPLYILAITSPAFILIAFGYLSVKAQWLEKGGVRALGWFITRIALPSAIFLSLSKKNFQDILHFDYLMIYAAGSLIAYFIIFGVARIIQKKPLTEAAFFGLGSSMSNSLLIGYPIIIELFGPIALVPFALTLIVENLIILPLSLALADTGKNTEARFLVALMHSLGLLSKNPIFLAIVAGIASSALSLSLPSVLDTVIDSLAATVSGLAQFTIGGILAGATLKLINRDMSLVLIGKLLIHPIAVLSLVLVLPPITPVFASIAVILASLPMFSVYAVLGMDYELSEFCSAVLLPTTIVSFITINLSILVLSTKYGFG